MILLQIIYPIELLQVQEHELNIQFLFGLKRSNVGEEAYVIAADNPDNNTEDALRFAPSGTDQLQYMFGGSVQVV